MKTAAWLGVVVAASLVAACGSPSAEESADAEDVEVDVDESAQTIGTATVDGKQIVVTLVQLGADHWVARYAVAGKVIQETRLASHAVTRGVGGGWNISTLAYRQVMASIPRGSTLARLLSTIGRTGLLRLVAGIATLPLFTADVIGAEGIPLVIPGTIRQLTLFDTEEQRDLQLEGLMRNFLRARRLPGPCEACFSYVDEFIPGSNAGWNRLTQWCLSGARNQAACNRFYSAMSSSYLSCSFMGGGTNSRGRVRASFPVTAATYPRVADVCTPPAPSTSNSSSSGSTSSSSSSGSAYD